MDDLLENTSRIWTPSNVDILTPSNVVIFLLLFLVLVFSVVWLRSKNTLLYNPESDRLEGIQPLAEAGVHARAMSTPSAALVEGQLPHPIPGLCIQAVMWFHNGAPSKEDVMNAVAPVLENHFRYRSIPVRDTRTGNVVWGETSAYIVANLALLPLTSVYPGSLSFDFLCLLAVDVNNHISDTTVNSSDEVNEYINERISIRLARDKPLWEVHVVHNRAGSSAVIWYIDHAIGDGVSLMIVAHEAFRDIEGRKVPFLIPPKRPFGMPHMTFTNKIKMALKGLWTSLKVIYLTQFLSDSSTVLKTGTYPTYVHHFPRAFVIAPPISIEYLQKIRTAFLEAKGYKITLNDLLFSVFTSTIRRYLLYRHDPSYMDAAQRQKLRLRLFMPLMFPRDPRLSPDDMLHNFWSMVTGRMPVGVEDPIERVVQSKKVMDAIKFENQAWYMRQVQLRSIDLLGFDAMRYISIRATTAHTLAWSNVPGFEKKVSFGSKIVDDMNFILSVPISYITAFSYAGHMNVTWAVDPDLVIDKEKLGFFQTLSVKELGDALGVEGDPVFAEETGVAAA
ncbi:hypothetical protein HDU93_002695 [Gonapodya sp. JEL0774]|nr:hypothetical protein HDU93_002695 [Gonapodya sp. JEL0774]